MKLDLIHLLVVSTKFIYIWSVFTKYMSRNTGLVAIHMYSDSLDSTLNLTFRSYNLMTMNKVNNQSIRGN